MNTSVLDHGFVRLDSYMASDLSVVNSARVSYAKTSSYNDDGTLRESDVGLIHYLMRNRHGTPFEHNSFRFHIKAPIVVFREWQRHRIGSFNEMSGRYSVLPNEFYVPCYIRSQIGKPALYQYESLSQEIANEVSELIKQHSARSMSLYEHLLILGVAKEQARIILPLNIYSEMYWTVNARSLMNFLSLRNHESAMWEIRQYAKVVEDMFSEVMPVTAQAFLANGRVAP